MKHVVSCSLGKDSVAMLLLMIEKKMQIDDIFWANTSLEFPENFAYHKKLQENIGREIKIVKPSSSFISWFYRPFVRGQWAGSGRIHGFPFVIQKGWCCREFKEKPLDKAHKMIQKEFGEAIVYIGYASDEPTRNLKPKKGITYKFPLREWNMSGQECRLYLEGKDLLNPLYYRFTRIGCWCCPKQSLVSLRNLYRFYPNHWKLLKKWERDCPHGFKPNFTLDSFENRMVSEGIIQEKEVVYAK